MAPPNSTPVSPPIQLGPPAVTDPVAYDCAVTLLFRDAPTRPPAAVFEPVLITEPVAYEFSIIPLVPLLNPSSPTKPPISTRPEPRAPLCPLITPLAWE